MVDTPSFFFSKSEKPYACAYLTYLRRAPDVVGKQKDRGECERPEGAGLSRQHGEGAIVRSVGVL